MPETDITFDAAGAMATAVGDEHGLTDEEWSALADETTAIVERLAATRSETPYRELPYNEDLSERPRIKESAEAKRGKFDDLVILGIGGSALVLTALKTALCPPYWNRLPDRLRGGRPRLWVMDNVDPGEVRTMLDVVDEKRTLFNVISKSGSTAETMAQFLIVRELLEACLGEAWREHVVLTTDAHGGLLRPFADAEGLESFVVPDGVGGRFSVLSPVGLFGAALLGIPIDGVLEGAAAMDERCKATDFDANPAAQSAAVQIGLYRKGKPMSVMMPYAAALKDVADWYRQLWAESLGKIRDDGTAVGPTPVKALGVTDQHSQVQLYREGPNDKVLTLLEVEEFETDVMIPEAPKGMDDIAYLAGKSLAALYQAELRGTAWALRLSKRPTVRIVLRAVDAHTVGGLLYLLEVQTSIAGEMLGINTYNQPGVEAGKEATRALIGKTGPMDPSKGGLPAELDSYEALRRRIEGE